MPGNSLLIGPQYVGRTHYNLIKIIRQHSERLVSSAARLCFGIAGDAMMMHTGSACYIYIYWVVFILPDKQNNKVSVLDQYSLECQISCPTKQRRHSLGVVSALQKSLAARIVINDDSRFLLGLIGCTIPEIMTSVVRTKINKHPKPKPKPKVYDCLHV